MPEEGQVSPDYLVIETPASVTDVVQVRLLLSYCVMSVKLTLKSHVIGRTFGRILNKIMRSEIMFLQIFSVFLSKTNYSFFKKTNKEKMM